MRIMLYTVIIVLVFIDLLAIVFYYKMDSRIKNIENDEFTLIIKRN